MQNLFRALSLADRCGCGVRRLSSIRETPYVMVLLGKPGGGKGTISKWLVKDYGFAHLSAGDLLRNEVKQNSALGQQAKNYMDNGKLVPDELISDIILQQLDHKLTKENKVLLDGFPRTISQAVALSQYAADGKSKYKKFVANLEVPSDEIIERLSDRWVHLPSGRVYSYKFSPPKEIGKDDHTGEELIRRSDDQPDKIGHRLQTYDKETLPLVEYYKNKKILKTFHGKQHDDLIKNDQRSKAIYKDLRKHLDEELKKSKSQ